MNSKPKILIVDDRPENLIALRVVLQDLDVELIEATNGNDALKATLKHDFVLALLDIQMPDMDGYELADILRHEEKTANLPFIFISAVYKDNHNIFKGYEKGAFSFIAKPFQPEILINKVKLFVDKYQQEISLKELNLDLKKKNKELALMNKDLESFSYSVSHDLKAPLRNMNRFSEMLRMNYENQLDDQAKHYLTRIVENSLKMGRLIDSILDLSRLGRKDVNKTTVDLDLLVEKITGELTTEHSSLKIDWKISPLGTVQGDEQLLAQVYFNLISNAIKYSSKKEKIEIEIGSEKENNETIYFVKDNGAGFDNKFKDKLFGVFQRLHSDDEFQGIGIGLAIVQRIINRHNGKVWAEGEENKGATFYFTIG